MKIFVEGGGDVALLMTACRKGFSEFLRKAGLAGIMPRIVACGGRQNAYDAFCTAMRHDEAAMLLVDSEDAVNSGCQQGEPKEWKPWLHLQSRPGDKWRKPEKATDQDCHLMVQCMESWFVADMTALEEFFGRGFHAKAVPVAGNDIESIGKSKVYASLVAASRHCESKNAYAKGEHSFRILATISPDRVAAASPWARRFLDTAKQKMKQG